MLTPSRRASTHGIGSRRPGGASAKRLVGHPASFVSTGVPRRAVLVFADEINVDLARRSFPRAARPLFSVAALDAGLSPEIHLHLFTSAPATGSRVHRQSGHDFAERLENAVETITQLGYDEVVAIGRDCPRLRAG